MNTLIAIAGILIAAALQARMPTLWWLGGVRLEFLPPLVAYAALTMPRRRALMLALVAAMTQDALSAAPFGVSALAYGMAAVLLSSLRDALDRDLPWVQLGAGALMSAATAIIAFFVVGISVAAVLKMIVVASISGVLTVILFFALDYARMSWGAA
jgi:cell shape-determining protein MreD